MCICTLTDKYDVYWQLIALLLIYKQPHNLTYKKGRFDEYATFIDVPVTNCFDLRTKYLFCKYRPINISVATEILINTEV